MTTRRNLIVAALTFLLGTSAFIQTSVQSFAGVTPSNELAPSVLMQGAKGPEVVACVGDSITAGVGASGKPTNYPSLLSFLLGMGFTVDNFGESGATLLKNGDSPYWQRGSFKGIADADPNIVIILLGTNDSKPWNWKHSDEFLGDYNAFIDYLQQLPNHPKVFVCSPPPVPAAGNYGINDPNVLQEIPIVEQIAAARKLKYIDVHSLLPNDSKYFIDNVHPNDAGYQLLAGAIYTGLTGAPAILPVASTSFSAPISVTIMPPAPGDTVRYTIDGSDPDRHSAIYMGAFTVSAPTTVRARVFEGRRSKSLITSTTYVPSTPS